MHRLLQDLKYALRQLRKSPGFTITAILTLAIGIGANTAVFTLVHAVMLKSLPVANPSELYRLGDSEMCCVNGGFQDRWALFNYGMYKQFRDSTPAFLQLAAFQAGRTGVGVRRIGSSQPAQSRSSEYVSGNYFTMFGIPAYAGRMMTQDDDSPSAPSVAVMSYQVWRDKYGGDPSVVGASFAINGQPFTVIGITPPGFFGDGLVSSPTALWLPLSVEPVLEDANSVLNRDPYWLKSIGRLAPGANPRNVEAQLTTELRQWLLQPGATVSDKERPEILQQRVPLTPGGAGVRVMRDQYEDSLKLLMWVTGFVLLIACANLANLMLSRAIARKQELSVRTALGASRRRLMRQALTESLLLAALGGVISLLVASAASRVMLFMATRAQSAPVDVSLSWPVLAFAFGITLLTGIVFGIVPAWLTSRTDPIDALRGANRSLADSGSRTQKSLVILQAAFSLTLLCAAGLVIQSLRNMQHQHFGFDTTNRYVAHFNPLMAGYKPEQLMPLYEQIRSDLQRIPGVVSASYSQYSPMSGDNWSGNVYIEGRASQKYDNATYVRVGPNYFDTIGTRILQGRPLTDRDTGSSQLVAVVNQAFAKKFLPGKNPIGNHFGSWDVKDAGSYEIIGVTEDTNYWGPTEEMYPVYFLPASQMVHRTDPDEVKSELRSLYLHDVVLRTSGPVPNLEAQVRQAFSRINPDLPVMHFAPFAEQVNAQFAQAEMIVHLVSFFGIVALLLASVGMYGVAAYNVERRRNEIGIRMALGADRSQVVRMVMRSALLLAAAGLVLGIPLSLAAGRFMTSRLYEVRAFNLAAFAAATLALAVCALLAGLLPARRAAAVDPMQALRAE
jgi:predicted permease